MNQATVNKKTLRVIVVFYLLIACEMLYMAGPFALYFYGVYSPILNFFNQNAVLAELNSFFMPHIAHETLSPILRLSGYVGATLAIAGFTAFLIGACQIYYSKFARKGAVTGGIYNYIRHPQYTAFAVCGLGLLIVWPRVINLLMFVSMLFVYYLLAKAEERECEGKFGQSYIDYKNKTGGFLPFKLPFKLPKNTAKRAFVLLAMYVCAITIAIFFARGMTNFSIDSLYAIYTKDSVIISLTEIEPKKLEQIMSIANTALGDKTEGQFVNYVLPTEWYAPEVPMNGYYGHLTPANYDRQKYKVIFTTVNCRREANGKNILLNIEKRRPIAEVWVDLDRQGFIKVLTIPEDYKYHGIPVAVY